MRAAFSRPTAAGLKSPAHRQPGKAALRLKRFVYQAERWLAETKNGEILFAPHPIRLRPGKYREPDAMIWRSEHKDRMGERESGPPDVVVEIISPGNEPHDIETKFREYAQAGIPEYWIVQPAARAISIYSLQDRAYRQAGHFVSGQLASSRVLAGFDISTENLFGDEGQ
ncbi:MAG: hypothetical protein C5B50_11705 [Verrucomicrobia bacterium]|nr:MAG: hypothetical protein C5B50_11705 [Verrucomicrobiota bacterium]